MRRKRSIVPSAQMSSLPLKSRGRIRLSVGPNILELDRSGIRSINGIILRSQCHLWAYSSSAASEQASGAYIFRPSRSNAACVGKPKVEVARGRLFTDVRLKYNSWAEQRFRFFGVINLPFDKRSRCPLQLTNVFFLASSTRGTRIYHRGAAASRNRSNFPSGYEIEHWQNFHYG